MSGAGKDIPDRTVRAWLVRYRDQDPRDPWLLALIAEALAVPGDPGKPARTGVTGGWLREQGELAAQAGLHAQPGGDHGGNAASPEILFRLRGAYDALGVSCGGWPVTGRDIADELLRRARDDYARALRHETPYSFWRIMEMQAAGYIPALGAIAPGARDVITGYVIRYFRAVLAGNDDTGAETTLRDLRDALPNLEDDTVAALRAAGIPADPGSLEHAARARELRRYWTIRDDDDSCLLAAVCQDVLADGTIEASEIGTTTEEIWETARAWTVRHARRAAAGDYEDLHYLTGFIDRSGLGYEPFGLTAQQIAAWEEARARNCWTRALAAGDGRAAAAADYITDHGFPWEQVTGQNGEHAWPLLQAAINAYAADLRRQVETAGNPGLARPPYLELAHFTALVRAYNEHAREVPGAPVADMPWEMPKAERNQFYDRYVSHPRSSGMPAPETGAGQGQHMPRRAAKRTED